MKLIANCELRIANCKKYRQLYAEYQSIRRQHKQQLIALENAIVPQCAALIFDQVKTILSQQRELA